MQSCPICTAAYTGVVRRKIACPSCRYAVCQSCVQQYLLSALGEPACMKPECRRPWSREFLDASLPPAWVHTKYRDHRRDVLLDRERSLLPATLPLAERTREVRRQALALAATYAHVRPALDRIERCHNALSNRALHLAGTVGLARPAPALRMAVPRGLPDLLRELVERSGRYTAASELGTAAEGGTESDSKRGARILFACPGQDCRGYIVAGARGLCGLCGTRVCVDCREKVPPRAAEDGPAAGGPESPAHVCDPEILASVELLARDSRPCPQCHSLIFRTDGCNQMFCTICHVSFCWRTLAVLTGPIHNPHYFEWRRNAQAEDGPAGGAHCAELGLTAYSQVQLDRVLSAVLRWARATARDRDRYGILGYLVHMTQFVNHTRANLARAFRDHDDVRQIGATDAEAARARNEALRVQFLVGDIDEDTWKARLQRAERKHERTSEFRNIWQAFWAAAEEIVRTAAPRILDHIQRLGANDGAGAGAGAGATFLAVRRDGTFRSTVYLRVGGNESEGSADDSASVAIAHARQLADLVEYTNAAQERAARRFRCRYNRIVVHPEALWETESLHIVYLETKSWPYNTATTVRART